MRHDRNRHGSGILLYIKSCFQYKILVKGPSNLELLFVSINQGPTIGVFYRPPSSPSIVMDTLFNTLSSLDIHVFSNLVLLGDFNIDTLSPSHYLYHHLSQILDCFSLSQVNSTPTHCSQSGRQTLIDLVLLSSPEHLISCETIPPLRSSDHLCLHVVISGQARQNVIKSNTRRKIRRYAQADFDSASLLLSSLDLNTVLDPNNINIS